MLIESEHFVCSSHHIKALLLGKPQESFFCRRKSLVDGQVKGRGIWVYVELGEEVEYTPDPSDDPKTDYKCFKRCSAFYGKSQEMLEEEKWLFTDENITVIIYC